MCYQFTWLISSSWTLHTSEWQATQPVLANKAPGMCWRVQLLRIKPKKPYWNVRVYGKHNRKQRTGLQREKQLKVRENPCLAKRDFFKFFFFKSMFSHSTQANLERLEYVFQNKWQNIPWMLQRSLHTLALPLICLSKCWQIAAF